MLVAFSSPLTTPIIPPDYLLTEISKIENWIEVLQQVCERIHRDCVSPILNSKTLSELEENIKRSLPLFTIARINLIELFTKYLDEEEIAALIRKSLEHGRDEIKSKLRDLPGRKNIEEEITLFIAVSKAAIDLKDIVTNLDIGGILRLYAIETQTLLLLYSIMETKEREVNHQVYLSIVEAFCKISSEYRHDLESLIRKHTKQGKRIIKLDELTECPLPPESDWE